MNYKNLLDMFLQTCHQNSDKLAFVYRVENSEYSISYKQVLHDVITLSLLFRKKGMKKGDKIMFVSDNRYEWIITDLAVISIGAILVPRGIDTPADELSFILNNASCSYLILEHEKTHEEYKEILKNHSLKSIFVIESIHNKEYYSYKEETDKITISQSNKEDFFKQVDVLNAQDTFTIIYTSGTTGKPKCICHRSGGVLIQHMKEHQLHCNIKENDNVFYFTTCGWMMWNWLVSSLASRASIVLFDGSPMFKSADLLLKIAQREKITLFGISAKYVDALRKFKPKLKYKFKLNKLRTICSTGSPLSEESFKYVYKHIKKNVHLSSISGGTDIVSCFVLGNLYQPVNIGEIQNNGLALDVDVLSDKGKSLKNSKGELVCKNPFPSMPLKFWNDKNDIKFKSAYFNRFKNIWHHGDYAEIKNSGGYIIHGRSDTTLNPGGVRLGTAEIYSEVEKFKEIKESIVVGQSWDNDVRIVLFIVMSKNYSLTAELINKIKLQIKKNASPRHVPSKIIVVKDIPRTKSGKIVELAVKSKIEGSQIKNIEALANPEALQQYSNLKELSI